MDVALDLELAPIEAGLFIADTPHTVACGLFHRFMGNAFRSADLASQNHTVGGRERFERDAGMGVRREI